MAAAPAPTRTFLTQNPLMFTSGHYVTCGLKVSNAARCAAASSVLVELSKTILRNEPGCTIYTVQQDKSDPARFVVWERFDDEAAFTRHLEQPYVKTFLASKVVEFVRIFVTDLA